MQAVELMAPPVLVKPAGQGQQTHLPTNGGKLAALFASQRVWRVWGKVMLSKSEAGFQASIAALQSAAQLSHREKPKQVGATDG